MENKNKKAGINQPENISLPFKIEECLTKGLMLELIMRLGKKSLDEMIEDDIEKLCGARYVHNTARENSRWSRTNSEVTLGGCKASVKHSRVRNIKSSEEVSIPVLKTLKNLDLLKERHAEQMIIGVSTRKVKRSLEGQTAFKSYGTSKSAVSRNFVSLTRKKLADWLGRNLDTEYPFIMIDWISFRGKTVLIALGISKDGHKSVLGAWEGSTENARVCTDLLQNLIERGLHQESVKLLIMDGGKGIHKAVRDVFGNNMLMRWISSALLESEGNFRRVKGYRSIPVLLDKISQLNNFVLSEVA